MEELTARHILERLVSFPTVSSDSNLALHGVECHRHWIAQAHQADEYLDLTEFAAGQRFTERLLEDLA